MQERSGVREMASRVGQSIHDRIPDRAQAFLRDAPLIVTGLLDEEGFPWASVTTGLPGIVGIPDERTLILRTEGRTLLPRGVPRAGDPIGLLALDPATRSRARVNGRVRVVREDGLQIDVRQAYSNCPKYIQKRRADAAPDASTQGPGSSARPAPSMDDRLSPEQIRWIQEADTFFIASAHPKCGADASHRGGPPGFLCAEECEISWPEYAGNMMFNTLGNLEALPRAGLAFVDFRTGATLRITGSARIDWGSPPDDRTADTGRRVIVGVRRVVETAGEIALSFSFEEYSPHNPPRRSGGPGSAIGVSRSG